MQKLFSTVIATLTAATLMTGVSKPAGAGPTALEILNKTQSVINSAKTYQATLLVTSNVGKAGSFTMRVIMKTAGKKGSFSTSPVGQPTGQFAVAAAAAGNSQVVDDGTTMTIYNPSAKTYVKRPSQGGVSPGASFRDISRITKNADLTLAPQQTIAGKPVFVIVATPKGGKGGRSKTTIYIDQATYHLREMKMEAIASGAMGQSPTPSTFTVQIQGEKYNEPIPDSAFRFTPPPGSKEMQGGMMGGLPGGSGAGPGR